MSDKPQQNRSLSEISHLFLSSVRERQTGGAARPHRRPPSAARDVSIDLTPEEFAQVLGHVEDDSKAPQPGPVTAILGSHLNADSFSRVREYAANLCADGSRIGLIECDSSIFRVMLFERNPNPSAPADEEPVIAEGFDAHRMHEAIEELSWDVDRWLVLLPSPRSHDARMLLREIEQWVLLSTCDHDGVVSSYRTLKGLADLKCPHISLALLDAGDEIEADRVFHKLSSVSQQFLSCPLEAEAPVHRGDNIAEHLVLCCRATRDKAQLATAPQWQLLADLVARSKSGSHERKETTVTHMEEAPLPKQVVADVVIPDAAANTMDETMSHAQPIKMPTMTTAAVEHEASEVIDLPGDASTPAAIISAVLHGESNQLVECPVKPPMCPDATLTVGRDHRITLIAVARQGLADLRAIGRAYQWLMENRPLIAMALPQFAIDAHQLPRLQLLVDQADASADILQPMLQSSNVTVTAYRKLRWAGRTGLLLNAA